MMSWTEKFEASIITNTLYDLKFTVMGRFRCIIGHFCILIHLSNINEYILEETWGSDKSRSSIQQSFLTVDFAVILAVEWLSS